MNKPLYLKICSQGHQHILLVLDHQHVAVMRNLEGVDVLQLTEEEARHSEFAEALTLRDDLPTDGSIAYTMTTPQDISQYPPHTGEPSEPREKPPTHVAVTKIAGVGGDSWLYVADNSGGESVGELYDMARALLHEAYTALDDEGGGDSERYQESLANLKVLAFGEAMASMADDAITRLLRVLYGSADRAESASIRAQFHTHD